MNKYYVYIHRRASDNTPFYVGKGSGKRANTFVGRNNWWHKIKDKHGVIVDIVFDSLSEEDAFEAEKNTLLEFRYFGYELCNLTDGGEGGTNPSIETRKKMSERKLGITPHNKGKPQVATAGNLNPSADTNVYEFEHTSGESFIGTRYDLCSTHNLNTTTFGKIFYVPNRVYSQGWKVKRKVENVNT